MTGYRSVVITGAGRGLGLATAAHLYARGWRVVAAVRSVDTGLAALRAATGAGPGDPRLIGVRLDLLDPESITAAAVAIEAAVGAPDALVHNAGIAAAGMVEETPIDLWQTMFATHLFGPVALTRALLPALRGAGGGRIVLVSSAGGVHGMPSIAAYSAAKGALERWGESLAGEVAPFGIGVTVLVTGVFDTEIITDAGTTSFRDFDGPYRRQHITVDRRGRAAMKIANPPAKFARALTAALDDRGPYTRRAVGADAAGLLVTNRLLPAAVMHRIVRMAMGLPGYRALSPRPAESGPAVCTSPGGRPHTTWPARRLARLLGFRRSPHHPPSLAPPAPEPGDFSRNETSSHHG